MTAGQTSLLREAIAGIGKTETKPRFFPIRTAASPSRAAGFKAATLAASGAFRHDDHGYHRRRLLRPEPAQELEMRSELLTKDMDSCLFSQFFPLRIHVPRVKSIIRLCFV
jgi:hypothetical protein